ncbi:hypothetical protein B0J11DRAFT_186915 [Dendryphion nanum]|uniref:Uncharacterized protein n=1 Tax=Dendryphion nanum TaxID=256645 RepID=A0A9P9D449_9PLEO|nr:hypothetical protein B0J11DRAFT_186915 [Dendryphion nanum]
MSTPKIYLITGANRGIGSGFTKFLLQRPSTTVIAAVRDPSHSTSKDLADLPAAKDSKLILVPLDSSVESAPKKAVEIIKQDYDIKHIDVVIANAGIGADGGKVRTTTTENITKHFAVNTIGPVLLFQATADLLQASPSKNPIFVAISTMIGSMGSMEMLEGFPTTHSPYGGSKAALNWFVRRLHFEEPWLTSFVFHPGLVATDMSASVIAGTGLKLEDFGGISVDTSTTSMLSVIDGATREIGGSFKNYDGTALPW